jgi:hypothetical protein
MLLTHILRDVYHVFRITIPICKKGEKMAFICPKCGKSIDDSHILVSQDMALCDSCGEMHVVSELTAPQSDTQFQSEPESPESISYETNSTENEAAQEETANLQGQIVVYEDLEIYKPTAQIDNQKRDIDKFDKNYWQQEKKPKKPIAGLIIAIFFGIFGIIFAIINGFSNRELQSNYSFLLSQNSQLQTDYDYLNSRNSLLQSEYDGLNSQYSQLQSKYNAMSADYAILEKLGKFNVTSIKCGNYNDSGWINYVGNSLYSNQMRYLMPRITYNSISSESITFNVKVISPSGVLETNSYSSPGYTYSLSTWLSRGTNLSADMSGWGNGERSIYRAGEWTVEVWYNNACLRSEKVRIW